MSGSRAGESWDGYSAREVTPAEDRKPVDSAYAPLWPPGTEGIGAGPGHQAQPKTTIVHDAPAKPGGKRPRPRKAK